MTKSTLPTHDDTLQVMRLLADVAAVRGDAAAQWAMLVQGLSRLTGLEQGLGYIGTGYRVGSRRGPPQFVPTGFVEDPDATIFSYMAALSQNHRPQDDPFCVLAVPAPKAMNVITLERVLASEDPEARRSVGMQYVRAAGVHDSVVAYARPCNGDDLVGVAFHQVGSSPKVRARQSAVLALASRELARLVERGIVMLPGSRDRSEREQLPPRLREVLDLLLEGEAPKRIARRLGISVWTVREHIGRLYCRLGVSGRDELMARFVKGAGQGSRSLTATVFPEASGASVSPTPADVTVA